jgi:hypothetical protein
MSHTGVNGALSRRQALRNGESWLEWRRAGADEDTGISAAGGDGDDAK